MERIYISEVFLGSLLMLHGIPVLAATLQAGPTRTFKTPCQAIAAAESGDVIEIDPVLYSGDVCPINTPNLTLKGVNGRPHLAAAGQNSQGKGIWVVNADNIVVDNVEFSGATVSDDNGAGIRVNPDFNLTVTRCYFHDNQDGILTDNGGSISILYSEFDHNGYSSGYAHNLYIGNANVFTFMYNWSHNAIVGHLVKSRAAVNYILYNRLTDESGTASYELDLPNGGNSFVIGNIIQQGPNSENSAILAYLEEGVSAGNPGMQLFVINNTFVNDKSTGTFLDIGSADTVPVVAENNIFNGPGTLSRQASTVMSHNFAGDPQFVGAASYNYQLLSTSAAINAGILPGTGAGFSLVPTNQYVQPTAGQVRTIVGAIDIGAYQYNGAGAMLTGALSCDVDAQGTVNVVDVQLAINQALGTAPCTTADLQENGQCNVVDVQRVISTALGGTCLLGP
jgi:hypothetical protein